MGGVGKIISKVFSAITGQSYDNDAQRKAAEAAQKQQEEMARQAEEQRKQLEAQQVDMAKQKADSEARAAAEKEARANQAVALKDAEKKRKSAVAGSGRRASILAGEDSGGTLLGG